jgi:hypothetical protein
LNNLNENFFDFFDFAVQKFCGSRLVQAFRGANLRKGLEGRGHLWYAITAEGRRQYVAAEPPENSVSGVTGNASKWKTSQC